MKRISRESRRDGATCLSGLLLLLSFVGQLCAAEQHEYLLGAAVHQLDGERALLFGTYVDCYGVAGSNEAGAILLVNGSTSISELERIAAARFLYAGGRQTVLPLIIGDYYPEGPARDPFILLPKTNVSEAWESRTIYSGWAEIEAVYADEEGRLVARAQRLSTSEDGWLGQGVDFSSNDGGRTWSAGSSTGAALFERATRG